MVITEPNCCKHLLYHVIHWIPVIAFFALIALSIMNGGAWWLLMVAAGIFALIWCNAITMWMHRCGLDLVIFGLDLIADTDRGFLYISQETPIVVSACIKIDLPDNLDEFRQFVHGHFMSYRRCRSTIVRIWNNDFFKEEKKIDLL